MVARLIVVFVCCAVTLYGQQLEEGQRNGLIQGTASLYPSWMLNRKVQNNYVAGHLNYFFHDKYSFRGEFMTYIDAQSDQKYVAAHTQIQAGFGRHFPIKRWNPYVYYTMGLSSIRLQSQQESTLQPSVGLIAGVQFHVFRYFYFFAEGSYQHMQDPSYAANLDQLYVTAGLGFQFPTKK